MSTYTQIIYQIVFHTKHNLPTLEKQHRAALFAYIASVLKGEKCFCFQVGGIENHLHIVTHIHPSIALADVVKDIKLSSTKYIKANHLFPLFSGWQDGYGAFTYTVKEKERLINYVINQEAHHSELSALEEYKELLAYHGIDYDEKYLP